MRARSVELERQEARLVALAVQNERAAVARDLHDIVAHHLSVIVVQAAAARLANGDRDAYRATIRAAGQEALRDVDRLVHLLADADDVPLAERLAVLADHARSAGLTVALELPGATVQAAEQIVLIAREALTNAIKHAPGTNVRIRVAARADAVDVVIDDDGSSAHAPLAASGAGLGLTGMRERVGALGGSVSAGPRSPRGWSVRVTLPRAAASELRMA